MHKKLFLCFLGCVLTSAYAQNPGNAHGGQYVPASKNSVCLTPQQRAEIQQVLTVKKDSLKRAKNSVAKNTNTAPLFAWPVQHAEGLDYTSSWAISGYIDHNTAAGQLTDYNCGEWTYDTPGYNHSGIDIYTWPFSWWQMENNQSMAVAAAPGEIIYKNDGNFDKSCSFNSNDWNAVYVMHSDGSVAWYGHLKKNSLTTKQVGETVAQGEFLGFIGSSGNSTGPHLHFEVYDSNNNLIDPYAGPCNDYNEASWWQEQLPYQNPNINALMTHSAVPQFNDCPETESVHAADAFSPGDVVYVGLYLRDQLAGSSIALKVRRPNNTNLYNWVFDLDDEYTSSYWYWPIEPDMEGTWSWQATYQGQTVTHYFTVGELGVQANSLANTTLSPNPAESTVHVNGTATIIAGSIFDATGKIVSEEKNPDGITQLDVAPLASGMYYVTLKDAAGNHKTVKLLRK